MFATQLNGVFQKIVQEQNENIEDAARLLAQATIAEGKIYIYGTNEMAAITSEAVYGAEPLPNAVAFTPDMEIENITTQDRFLILTRSSTDEKALSLARKLYNHGISFVAVYSSIDDREDLLKEPADVCITIPLKRGLIPTEDGSRIGLPYSMAALYIYYGIKFTIDEILTEMEEEL